MGQHKHSHYSNVKYMKLLQKQVEMLVILLNRENTSYHARESSDKINHNQQLIKIFHERKVQATTVPQVNFFTSDPNYQHFFIRHKLYFAHRYKTIDTTTKSTSTEYIKGLLYTCISERVLQRRTIDNTLPDLRQTLGFVSYSVS